jgi:ferrochelatase
MSKKAVLLMAYGSPDREQDVLPFYTDIRRGVPPSSDHLDELIERYKLVGAFRGPSRLYEVSSKVKELLSDSLEGDYVVYLGMRHWSPWISDVVEQMKLDGITEAVAIVLAPHYSTMSVAAYQNIVKKALDKHNANIEITFVDSWHMAEDYIEAIKDLCLDTIEDNKIDLSKTHFFLTAHSLPKRILSLGDTYQTSLFETSKELVKRLNIEHWSFAYTSKGASGGEWLGPDICDAISEKKKEGFNSFLTCTVGFLVDHLEVRFDIDIEAQQKVKELNAFLYRVPTLNTHPGLIKTLTKLVLEKCQEKVV